MVTLVIENLVGKEYQGDEHLERLDHLFVEGHQVPDHLRQRRRLLQSFRCPQSQRGRLWSGARGI